MRSKRRSHRRLWEEMDEDPGAGLLNLFDVWIAFAVALLLAMVSYMRMPELFGRSDITVIKNPGSPSMEIIEKKGEQIKHYRATSQQLTGQGERLGTAYRLSNGEVVYVPDNSKPSPSQPLRDSK
jgi:hypothetical protein